MKKFMRKIQVIIIIVLFAGIFTGCKSGDVKTEDRTEEKQVEEKQTEEKQAEGKQAEESPDKLWTEDEKSCFILEDENHIYACGTYCLLKIDKNTKEAETLWESEDCDKNRTPYFYFGGQGLLLNDKVYFMEVYRDEDRGVEHKALSVIGTDKTGYERICEVGAYSLDSMIIVDGILYFDGYSGEEIKTLCYQVYEDGSIAELKEPENSTGALQDYEREYYYDNGDRVLFLPEAEKNFGYLLLKDDDFKTVKMDRETGKKEALPEEFSNLQSYNEKYFLSMIDKTMYLIDQETLSVCRTITFDDDMIEGSVHVITMDNDYVYVQYITEESEDMGEKYVYEKISLDGDDRNVIFVQDEIKGMNNCDPTYMTDVVVKNGYLYYAGAGDYKLYLMRRNLENPSEEEILGEAFCDSGVGKVGTIQTYHEKIYSQTIPDMLLTETDLEWLQVDERFAGAEEINRYLTEKQNGNMEYESSNVEWMEEMVKEYGEEGIFHYSYSSSLSEISWFDEHYLSFCQQDYDYTGGAHGMPLRIGYTFDLHTGQRLSLEDIIGNSEEELKDIVTEYFAEYIGQNPDDFWEDAIDTVREETDFESDFYLTEEGIMFYFHPYELSSYAAGFQEVSIPYGEFTMKILLQNK